MGYMPKGDVKTVMVAIRVTKKERKEINKVARRERLTTSKFLRKLLVLHGYIDA